MSFHFKSYNPELYLAAARCVGYRDVREMLTTIYVHPCGDHGTIILSSDGDSMFRAYDPTGTCADGGVSFKLITHKLTEYKRLFKGDPPIECTDKELFAYAEYPRFQPVEIQEKPGEYAALLDAWDRYSYLYSGGSDGWFDPKFIRRVSDIANVLGVRGIHTEATSTTLRVSFGRSGAGLIAMALREAPEGSIYFRDLNRYEAAA